MLAKRIAYFERVRDIPYRIGLDDADDNMNCVTKCELLADALKELGLQSRQILCTFDWTETPFSKDILALPRDPGETHLFLEVLIPETKQWVRVDPSWDKKLKKAGFPIARWDGLTDTVLAVKPHVIYPHEDTERLLNEEDDGADDHMTTHAAFYSAINRWLEEQRKV